MILRGLSDHGDGVGREADFAMRHLWFMANIHKENRYPQFYGGRIAPIRSATRVVINRDLPCVTDADGATVIPPVRHGRCRSRLCVEPSTPKDQGWELNSVTYALEAYVIPSFPKDRYRGETETMQTRMPDGSQCPSRLSPPP